MLTTMQVASSRVRMGYASGVVVGILLPIALYLFGIVTPIRSLSLIFLLVGVWTILFGYFYQGEKGYWIGWGAGIAVLSTVAIVPFSYTLGLVLMVIVILILATAFGRRTKTIEASNRPPPPTGSNS